MKEDLPSKLFEALSRGRRVVVAGQTPDRGMKTLSLLCACTLLYLPKAFGQVQPAYRFVEGLSDRVYSLARVDVVDAALPARLSRSFKAAPGSDSAAEFERRFEDDETAFLSRLQGSRAAREGRPRQWQTWIGREQAGVVSDSVGQTLRRRYGLDLVSRLVDGLSAPGVRSEPSTVAAAALAAGAVAYIGGVRTSFSVGRLSVEAAVRPGYRLRRAARSGCGEHLGDLRLALKDRPVSVSAQYGLDAGRVHAERVSLDYRLKF